MEETGSDNSGQPSDENHSKINIHNTKDGKKSYRILIALLVVSFIFIGVLFYSWQNTKDQLATAQQEASVIKKERDEMAKNIYIEQTNPKPSYSKFDLAYSNILMATETSPVNEEVNDTEILQAVASYYKMDELPAETAVLAVYNDEKDTTRALVYYPATDEKPAGFIDMYKTTTNEWKYQEYL